MKIRGILYISVLLMLLVSGKIGAQHGGEQSVSLKTNIESEYKWNAQTLTWQLSAVMRYGYNPDGNLTDLVKYDAVSGDSISRVDYFYDPSTELSAYIVSLWAGQDWMLTTKYSYTFSSSERESQRISRWDGTGWINGSLDTLYVYGIDGLLLQSENFQWKNEAWVKDHTIVYEYGDNGRISRRYSLSTVGDYLSQVFYLYDEQNNLKEMYAQFYRSGQWENEWRRTYLYDRCRVLKTLIRQAWDGSEWINVLKSEFEHTIYWNGPVNGKVDLCHKGRTITVSVNAMEVHLQHGDCIGRCAGGDEAENEAEIREKMNGKGNGSYIIYPNPASDKFTVSSADCSDPIIKAELFDIKGNLVKFIPGNNCLELTIDRGDLKSGKYFVIITGGKSCTSVVILK